jgi:hypothetical protein
VDEEAPGGEPAREGQRARGLPRVPTPLIVTVLGITLSAWLLPAVTRQWDDRQKAHDLKAALVAEMAPATADALTDLPDLSWRSARSHPTLKNFVAGYFTTLPQERTWSQSSLTIEGKLRSYFGDGLGSEWRDYRTLVALALVDASRHAPSIPVHTVSTDPEFATVHKEIERFQRALDKLASPDTLAYLEFQNSLDLLQTDLLSLEERIAADVLRSHVAGYSTTPGDFLHDLVP